MPNRHSTLNSLFTDIAAAIRNKKGESSSTTYKADDFDTAIASIPVGIKEEDDPATMTSQLATVAEGEAYLYTGTSTTDYKNGRLYVVEENPLSIPLCFTANTAGSKVTLTYSASNPWWVGSYSTDGINWDTYTPEPYQWGGGTYSNTITLTNIGDKVYFKGDISSSTYEGSGLRFVMSGSIAASGNINSLYTSNDFENLTTLTIQSCYYQLFFGCALTKPPLLPATALSWGCYSQMFSSCSSLTAAPVLPATTLATQCYANMFNGCTSLTTAPALPATTLAEACYAEMFYDCSSLTTPPALPATTLAYQCYAGMFSGCTSLTTPPILPATTLAENCYRTMFQVCTSLTTSPSLPATNLAASCYEAMFYGCTNLTILPALPATTLATDCYKQMFSSGWPGLYVADASTTSASHAWTIPTSGTFTNTYSQTEMFFSSDGVRASDDMAGIAGQSYTYYIKNTPV